jgi:chromosome segregation ATPase
MNLPDFIANSLGFQRKVEGHFEAQAELATALSRINALENEKTDLEQKVKEFSAKVSAVNEENLTLKAQADASAKAIEAAKAEAARVIVSQGVPQEQLPAAGVSASEPTDILKQLASIDDPADRARFFSANRKAIFEAGKTAKAR